MVRESWFVGRAFLGAIEEPFGREIHCCAGGLPCGRSWSSSRRERTSSAESTAGSCTRPPGRCCCPSAGPSSESPPSCAGGTGGPLCCSAAAAPPCSSSLHPRLPPPSAAAARCWSPALPPGHCRSYAGPRRLQEHQQQKTVESVSHQQSKQQHAWIVPERSNMTHLACGASTSRIATFLRRSRTRSWSRPRSSRDPRPPSLATEKAESLLLRPPRGVEDIHLANQEVQTAACTQFYAGA